MFLLEGPNSIAKLDGKGIAGFTPPGSATGGNCIMGQAPCN